MISTKSIGQNLSDLKWKNRILIVKTLNSDSINFQDQLDEFKNSNEDFKERKLTLVTIRNDHYSLVDFTTNYTSPNGKVNEIISKNILDIKQDFEVILIGLDGRIKLRQNQILLIEDLLRIIDAMPMRINEIKN